MSYFITLTAFCILAGITPSAYGQYKVSCYNCGHHNPFPGCLVNTGQCGPDQSCYMQYSEGHVLTWCATVKECTYIHGPNCTVMDANKNCEICCHDDKCVLDLVAAFLHPKTTSEPSTTVSRHKRQIRKRLLLGDFFLAEKVVNETVNTLTDLLLPHYHSHVLLGGHGKQTTHPTLSNPTTMKPVVVTPTHAQSVSTNTCKDELPDCSTVKDVCSNSLAPSICRKYCGMCPTPTAPIWERLLTGPCGDMLVPGACRTGKAKYCKDESGVALCAETCGLCSALKTKFVSTTICTDQMINNGCAKTATIDFCKEDYAKDVCPSTCEKCDSVILKEIDNIIRGTPSW